MKRKPKQTKPIPDHPDHRLGYWLRDRKYRSYREFAKKNGFNQSTIQKLNTGFQQFSLELMRDISRALNIKPSQLLIEADSEPRPDDTELAILSAIRTDAELDPILILTAAKAVAAAAKAAIKRRQIGGALAGDPLLAAQLADSWAELTDIQRGKALDLIRAIQGFAAAPIELAA